jgi:hypothetical protein
MGKIVSAGVGIPLFSADTCGTRGTTRYDALLLRATACYRVLPLVFFVKLSWFGKTARYHALRSGSAFYPR